jgi:DNA-binding MarR family transcriptional regulator
MNTYSSNGVAVTLGVSRRRVMAAADRGSIGTWNGRRRVFTEEDVTLLREQLGSAPVVASLSRGEVAVLAELSRRPCGLVSARAVARACGLSPATAAKAVRSLVAEGLVVESESVVALGRARRVRSLHANVRHPDWGSLLPLLRHAVPAARPGPSPVEPVPAHVRHAFWNVGDDTLSRVTPVTDGPFIATRALTTGDPDLLAYAAATVDPASWRRASRARGLADEQRALAASLAGARTDSHVALDLSVVASDALDVASLRDIAATKLKTIADRGELRDYFDLMVIEQRTAITIETALQDYQERYRTRDRTTVLYIIRALGTFSDVADDPGLPVSRASITRYWTRRVRTLAVSVDTTGTVATHPRAPVAQGSPAVPPGASSSGAGMVWVESHERNGRIVEGYWRRR